ncbi:MAG: helix-turn-helix domain-containing protein [Pseudomonadales bacterium]
MNEVVFQSPFGEWRFTTCAPPADLAPFIDSFWETQGTVGYGYEKLLPSGTAEFMVNLGPSQVVLQRPTGEKPATFQDAWLSGIQDAPLFTAPAHGTDFFTTHFVSASLKPEGVCEFFGVDAIDTARRVINAEDLVGQCIRSLRDRVGEAPSAEFRFAALSDFLRVQRLSSARPAPFAAVWAMGRTLALQGDLRVDDLCSELGISRKHLNNIYKSSTGLSPKTYARLTRFRSIVDRIQGPLESWVGIAADKGYFDQAHLIRDFKQFAGETPNSFLRNRGPDGESVNFADLPD